MRALRKSKGFDLDIIAEKSEGLSFADIHRICEDLTKDFLVYGSEEVSQAKLLSSTETENNLSKVRYKCHLQQPI